MIRERLLHFSILSAAFSLAREDHRAFVSSTRWKQLGLTARFKAGKKIKFTMAGAGKEGRQKGAGGESLKRVRQYECQP